MAVLHHPGAHRRGSAVSTLATILAFGLGFALGMPAALYLVTDVLPPMLPLGEQVVTGTTAETMALVMATATGLAAAVCMAARRARR